MSGDLQARKRREKKKRKEDGPEIVAQQPPQQTTPILTDETNIHVQKEVSTGGGLCAKFIFFILLSLLTGLVGLIITEHRGLTDLDTGHAESHIAQLFEGWVDKTPESHDLHSDLHLEDEDDHLEEEDAHQESEEAHESEEEHLSEEEEEEEEEEADVEDENTGESIQDETVEDEESATQDETVEDEESTNQDETVEDEESTNQDETVEDEESTNQDETIEDEESTNQDETVEEDESMLQDETVEEESTVQDETVEEEESMVQDETVEEEEDETVEEEFSNKDETTENNESVVEDVEESNNEDETAENEESAVQETLEDDNSVENVPEEESEESNQDGLKGDDSEEEETIQDVENAAIDKAQVEEDYEIPLEETDGVGDDGVPKEELSENTENSNEDEPNVKPSDVSQEPENIDLSRRNTIVSPPNFEEVEQSIVNEEEDYSEEYDSEAEESAQTKLYEELQAKYDFNSLSPDWLSKDDRIKCDEYEDESGDDLEDEEDVEYEQEEENSNVEEEVDEEEEVEEEEENEDNEELLKRLEAKYGKLYHSENESEDEMEDYELEEDFDAWKRVKVYPDEVSESDSENEIPPQHSGAQSIYPFSNITNVYDWNVKEDLDKATERLNQDAAYALTMFNKILESNPNSPRAIYGKAQSLDILAEKKRSNKFLNEAIATYQEVLKALEVPDYLFKITAERCIDRMRFRGLHVQAISIHQLLIEKFPAETKFRNNLAVTYLTINKIEEARKILNDTLTKWPNDGFALVHYGFILKTNDNNLEQGVNYLKRGLNTKQSGVIDGRFFFHLGDALTRLGRNSEALEVYQEGVENKLFLSKYQRSLYNINRLKGKPWWTKEETGHVKFLNKLEKSWQTIRNEGLSVLSKEGYFLPESENLRDKGDWKQFELFARGSKNQRNCKQCPQTCNIIESLPDAVGCKRGQAKFSVMHPGTHVWQHCGPTNCRLRIHLGLKVPLNTFLRVGEEIRSWQEGKVMIFDDSFEHEVWHNGTTVRLVLIVDVWHPELLSTEKRSLSPI